MARTTRRVKTIHNINSYHPSCFSSKKNYKAQMAAITKAFPKIKFRLTGEFLKLYTDSAEERQALPNPRAVSTDWKAFKINLNKNLSLFDFHPNNINNTNDLEQKITEFTEAVIDVVGMTVGALSPSGL
ncbi:hypothetical protein TNCV_4208141 [Trichonephila clavipes]|nr:hypothetical protein TNCV_4208141 [Trichonephila clavipes]